MICSQSAHTPYPISEPYRTLPFTRADLPPVPADYNATIFTVIDMQSNMLHVGRWERLPSGPATPANAGRFALYA